MADLPTVVAEDVEDRLSGLRRDRLSAPKETLKGRVQNIVSKLVCAYDGHPRLDD
ncbi:MAG TPA: hypothetical protein VKE96_07960 [Vicinamibacterales bacterium]|nr:hypothetical protein [Vicinamibacterales bacterium]